jgi:hypothetical protein
MQLLHQLHWSASLNKYKEHFNSVEQTISQWQYKKSNTGTHRTILPFDHVEVDVNKVLKKALQ